MLGNHIIKGWSKLQGVVALSSGEAEYYALVKGGGEGLGIKGIVEDMGWPIGIEIRTDASAAVGMVNRRGLGKTKHVETNQLWIQGHVYRGTIRIKKVGTGENLADAMTKPVDAGILEKHLEGVGCWIANGRHEDMPRLDDDEEEECEDGAREEQEEEEEGGQAENEVREEHVEEDDGWLENQGEYGYDHAGIYRICKNVRFDTRINDQDKDGKRWRIAQYARIRGERWNAKNACTVPREPIAGECVVPECRGNRLWENARMPECRGN